MPLTGLLHYYAFIKVIMACLVLKGQKIVIPQWDEWERVSPNQVVVVLLGVKIYDKGEGESLV